jgi:hypothetical protein
MSLSVVKAFSFDQVVVFYACEYHLGIIEVKYDLIS